MDKINHINSQHLIYLRPLLKWRVLDLNTLREETGMHLQKHNFYRIIRNLEKNNILETYRDPFNHKKYVYLGKLGEAKLQIKDHPNAISRETLLHDIKVSELSKAFLENGFVNEIELEHQIHDRKNFQVQYKIIPDAAFYGEQNGKQFKMAFELELTRKNNQRIIEKAKQFIDSSFYQYVMYFFSNERMMNQYIEQINEKVGTHTNDKFIYFHLPELTGRQFDLKDAKGFFRGKVVNVTDLFKRS